METNDRIEQVKGLLHRYHRTAVYIKNLKEEIADKKAQIEAMPAPKVPGYSPTPGGGANNLSPEERAYFANERALERITELQCRINELEPILLRVDRTLDALTVTDRNIIVSRCINHYPWNMTARTAHCSPSYCRRRIDDILALMADMMLGPGDIPVPMELFNRSHV